MKNLMSVSLLLLLVILINTSSSSVLSRRLAHGRRVFKRGATRISRSVWCKDFFCNAKYINLSCYKLKKPKECMLCRMSRPCKIRRQCLKTSSNAKSCVTKNTWIS